jgi:hypothetical protein
MIAQMPRSESAELLAAIAREDDGALRLSPARQRASQLDHRHRAGGIVVRAVEDLVVSGGGLAPAQVIQVRRDQDGFA